MKNYDIKLFTKAIYEEAKEVEKKILESKNKREINGTFGGILGWMHQLTEQREIENKIISLKERIEAAALEKIKFIELTSGVQAEIEVWKQKIKPIENCMILMKENILSLTQFDETLKENTEINQKFLNELLTLYKKCKVFLKNNYFSKLLKNLQ